MNQIGSTTLEPMIMVVQECFMVAGSLTRDIHTSHEKGCVTTTTAKEGMEVVRERSN